jgi:glycosyltransferase involved in cell wall biosynthesis
MISLKGKKIAISTAVIGGLGGAERNLFSVIKALPDCKIDVYTNAVIDSEYLPGGKNLAIFINKTLNWKTRRRKEYDLYLQYNFLGSLYLGDKINCKLKILNPCGNEVFDKEHLFDFIISQSPDGIKLFKNKKKNLLLNQPVGFVSDTKESPKGLPKKYFLTVFNPYGKKIDPIKGQDVLYASAKKLPFKIIWCYSLKTKKWKGLEKGHKNIIYLESVSQAKLRCLHENALAYISFSRKEGFGWSIADALLYQKPILSRNVGVLTYYKKPVKGIFIYKNEKELIKISRAVNFSKIKPNYDLTFISADKFREEIALLLEKI